MSHTQTSTSDDLLQALREALAAHPEADGVHVSIEPHAREWAEGAAGVTYVKALCWNLLAGGKELSEDAPELLVVHEDLDDESIRAEIARSFPGLGCVVDHDILIEEDD